MKPMAVVAALLVQNGRVLVTQRRAGAKRGLQWEFPGGKIEEGETPEAALSRELLEELGVSTQTGRIFDAKICAYPDQTVLVLFYQSRLLSGEAKPLDANALLWALPGELAALDFAQADIPVARRLCEAHAEDAPLWAVARNPEIDV